MVLEISWKCWMLWILISLLQFPVINGNTTGTASKSLVYENTPPPDDDPVMVCYYGSWAVYRPGDGKFDVEDIDPYVCTHLVYGFAGLQSTTHSIISLDPWNDLYDNYGKGAYLRFTGLKKLNPKLKTLLAIGGWNEGSIKYSEMAETRDHRTMFISSCVSFLKKYGFDGLDIDWEYPTLRGGRTQDKVNYAHLLDEMRMEFTKHGLLMTSAVSAGKVTIDSAYDVGALGRNLDLIHLMAYDLHGTWESYAHHHSPLYAYHLDKGNNAFLNVDWAVRYWLKLGLPPGKLVVGIGLYGRCFTLASADRNTVYSPAPQPGLPGPYTRQPGVLGYNEICEEQLHRSNFEKKDEVQGENWSGEEGEIKNKVDGEEDKVDNDRRKRDILYVEKKEEKTSESLKEMINGNEIKGDINEISEEDEDGKVENDDDDGDDGDRREEDNESEEEEEDERDESEGGGWTVVRDKDMISPYAYKDRQWCGYDDMQSVTIKAEYIKSLKLAGAMVWSIETDDFHGHCNSTAGHFPLITTIRTVLRDGKPIPTPTPPTPPTPTPPTNTTTTLTTSTTTPSPSPPPTPPPSDICHREGLNADPKGDCTIFYSCQQVEGKWIVYLFHCAPGTIFVEELQMCDFPEGHPECKILPAPGGNDYPDLPIMQQPSIDLPIMQQPSTDLPILQMSFTTRSSVHLNKNLIRQENIVDNIIHSSEGDADVHDAEDGLAAKKRHLLDLARKLKWKKAIQFLLRKNN